MIFQVSLHETWETTSAVRDTRLSSKRYQFQAPDLSKSKFQSPLSRLLWILLWNSRYESTLKTQVELNQWSLLENTKKPLLPHCCGIEAAQYIQVLHVSLIVSPRRTIVSPLLVPPPPTTSLLLTHPPTYHNLSQPLPNSPNLSYQHSLQTAANIL